MSVVPTPRQARARKAALSRSRDSRDPIVLAADLDLAEANLSSYILKVVNAAPPLTDDQITRVTALLRGTN